MKTTKKNICIIGCGRMGRLHSRSLSGSCNLTFHSRSAASSHKLNRELNGRGVYERFDDLLADSSVDAVVICSPPEFHTDHIIRSLRAGKTVLVEKPICISQDELLKIETVVEETKDKAFLMVAENYLYKPLSRRLRAWLTQERIGHVQSVTIRKVFHQSSRGWRSQYGALIEGGVHFVALLADIMNDKPQRITSRCVSERQAHIERRMVVDLSYGSGARAQLEYGWDAPRLTTGLFQHSSILGDEGKVVFESNGLYAYKRGKGGVEAFICPPVDVQGYKAMMRDFLGCLNDRDRRPYSTYERAKETMSIIFGAYGSNQERHSYGQSRPAFDIS